MKQPTWFKHPGIFYLPVHPAGYVVTFMAIFFLIPVSLAVFRNGHLFAVPPCLLVEMD